MKITSFGLKRLLITVGELILLIGVCVAVLIFASSEFTVKIKSVIGENGISADALRQRVGENVSVSLVYSPLDGYSQKAAQDLGEKLETTGYIKAGCYADTDFDPESPCDLTLYLGHTIFCAENYLSAYERLGPDGLEITAGKNADGDIDRLKILAFNEKQLKRGIDSFSEYFLSASRLYKAINSLCFSEKGKTRADIPERQIIDGDSYGILSLSYPAGDSYSIAVIRRFIAEKAPDLLLLNGGFTCGDTRAELSDNWTGLYAELKDFPGEIRMRPSLKDENGSTASELAKDVANSVFRGYPAYGRENTYVMLCTPENEPIGFIFTIGLDGDDAGEIMQRYTALAQRAARRSLPSVTFMQQLPASVAEELPAPADDSLRSGVVINEAYAPYVSEEADANYDAAKECGCSVFVFSAGYTNTGVFKAESGAQLALNGSVNFGAPGVGGGFALNNSLRGGLYISFDFTGDGSVGISYVYASEYGLTVKNVG